MWPTTFGVKTYMIFYALSIVVHIALACWYAHHLKCRIRTGLFLGFCYLWGMTTGAKILYDLLHGQFGGLGYFRIQYYLAGGLWGGPFAYLAVATPVMLAARRDRAAHLDLVVLPLVVPMVLAKVGCLCNGCCYGATCNLPWAVAYPQGAEPPAGVLRHPTPVYEILVLLTILVVFAVLDRRRWKGTLLLWFVAIYGVGRPLTEVFRGDGPRVPDFGALTASQVTCLAGALTALAILLIVSYYRIKPRQRAVERESGAGPSASDSAGA